MDPGVVHAERAKMAFIMAVSTRCLNSSSVARTSTGRRARAFYILNSQDRRVCGAKVKGRDFDQASGPDPWSRDAAEAGIAVEGAWIARDPGGAARSLDEHGIHCAIKRFGDVPMYRGR